MARVSHSDTSNTYWQSEGRYQTTSDALEALIPAMGECPPDNPKLDRFRRAANCYYDLWNNGLCNRGREFNSLFRMGGQRAADDPQALDRVMDKIILRAAKEQGIEIIENRSKP